MAKPYLDALDFTDDIKPDVFAPVYTEPDAILEREQLRHVLELAFISIAEHGTPTGGSKIRARDNKTSANTAKNARNKPRNKRTIRLHNRGIDNENNN